MTKQELIKKLSDIEWEDFEVKEAKVAIPKNSWETVSAFSNTAGGWLIFGVEKFGKGYDVVGVKNPEKIEQDFTTTLRGEKFNHKIKVKARKFNMEGKDVLAFYVPLSEKKPVYFNTPKNTFIRSASGDLRLTEAEVDSLYRDAAYGTKDKEKTSFSTDDLKKESLESYRGYLERINEKHPYGKVTTEAFLRKLRVIEGGKITIGGLLAFGTDDAVADYITDFRIDYLEIMGTSYSDAERRYEFRLMEYDNVYEYFFAIWERLRKKIDIPFAMKGPFRDEDQPQVIAAREALVNLLVHSDYFSPMKPRIRVFSDRIEFLNPGALPKPYEELRKSDISLPRNPILTKIFRVIKLAENAGYGFDKMFDGWLFHYPKEPVVDGGVDYYRITFPLELKKKDLKPKKVVRKGGQKEVVRKGGQILTEKQHELLNILKHNPKISRKEISAVLGINESAVQKRLDILKRKQVIKRVGPDKGGHWKVV